VWTCAAQVREALLRLRAIAALCAAIATQPGQLDVGLSFASLELI